MFWHERAVTGGGRILLSAFFSLCPPPRDRLWFHARGSTLSPLPTPLCPGCCCPREPVGRFSVNHLTRSGPRNLRLINLRVENRWTEIVFGRDRDLQGSLESSENRKLFLKMKLRSWEIGAIFFKIEAKYVYLYNKYVYIYIVFLNEKI